MEVIEWSVQVHATATLDGVYKLVAVITPYPRQSAFDLFTSESFKLQSNYFLHVECSCIGFSFLWNNISFKFETSFLLLIVTQILIILNNSILLARIVLISEESSITTIHKLYETTWTLRSEWFEWLRFNLGRSSLLDDGYGVNSGVTLNTALVDKRKCCSHQIITSRHR